MGNIAYGTTVARGGAASGLAACTIANPADAQKACARSYGFLAASSATSGRTAYSELTGCETFQLQKPNPLHAEARIRWTSAVVENPSTNGTDSD